MYKTFKIIYLQPYTKMMCYSQQLNLLKRCLTTTWNQWWR